MKCSHSDSFGCAFCRQCGAQLPHRRCSIGHINADDALFCGECGENLGISMPSHEDGVLLRFDLQQMLQEAEADEHMAIVSKEMVSQADIRKLLAKRRAS